MIQRRGFLALIGGAAAASAWPLASRAQEAGRVYRLGALIPAARQAPGIVAFFDEMRLSGFAEGQNLAVIPGGFDVSNDQIDERVNAIIAAAPDVIISGPDQYAAMLQRATRTIPIVAMTEDMVAAGLVASLARPGGNITGISLLSPELDGKRQELLIEAVPGIRRMAALSDATAPRPLHLQTLRDAARARGVELTFFGVAKREDAPSALGQAKASGAEAVNILASPLFSIPGSPSGRLFNNLLTETRLPAILQWPESAEEGALLSYGPRFSQTFRQRARLVARVLRGAKPADIPVEQPTNFELVVNLKVAKAIGHEMPAGLVLRADKVVE